MKGGRSNTPTRKISFVSLVVYGPKVSLLNLSHGDLQLLKPSRVVPTYILCGKSSTCKHLRPYKYSGKDTINYENSSEQRLQGSTHIISKRVLIVIYNLNPISLISYSLSSKALATDDSSQNIIRL